MSKIIYIILFIPFLNLSCAYNESKEDQSSNYIFSEREDNEQLLTISADLERFAIHHSDDIFGRETDIGGRIVKCSDSIINCIGFEDTLITKPPEDNLSSWIHRDIVFRVTDVTNDNSDYGKTSIIEGYKDNILTVRYSYSELKGIISITFFRDDNPAQPFATYDAKQGNLLH